MAETPKIIQVQHFLEDRYHFRLNVVSNDIEVKKKGSDTYEIMNENTIIIQMLRDGFKGIDKDFKWLMRSDFVQQYDPFQEYFETLERWDGKTDHIKHLCSYITVKDPVWFTEMFKKHLVRVVACGLGAIPFNKHCFTFHGKQNDGKSYFVRHLSKPFSEYYTENIDFENKDGLIALCSNLIVNLDELAMLSRTDINRAKTFFTADKIKIRRPYESKPVTAQRRASFFASTNDDEFLTDSTGNVRWLIMKIDGINHDNGGAGGYGSVDINKVWSQAFHLFVGGYKYQLTREEIERSENQNREHFRSTPEIDLLRHYFEPSNKTVNDNEFVTTTEILRRLQRVVGSELKLNHISIGKALRFLGFEQQTGLDKNGMGIKGYYVKYFTMLNKNS
ncbi:VapE domain-containing protein [Emticicia sp. W12TSBA100-4]|uniref:VapE domain-containing protein n=1 Tax=Emticicia sp. W12TSBA100-4 TaxID=3160965 RepID=UPI0033059FFB